MGDQVSAGAKRADMIVHESAPYNAESPPAALAQGDITPLDAFYVRNHGPVPRLDAASWRLRVDGLVEQELELSLDDLQTRFAQRDVVATLQCAGNRRAGLIAVRDIPGEAPWGPGATGTASWRGVALADVLRAAGVRARARYVAFLGADQSDLAEPPQRFGGSIPIHKALAGEVLLTWSMNGEPLPALHGAPLRVVVPGYIGARSVKWLERITAAPQPSDSFFQAQSYRLLPPDAELQAVRPGTGVALGAVAVNADILVPDNGAELAAGPVEVAGYAFAGDDRRIVRVDISTDEGEHWQQAELLAQPSPWAWRRWRTTLTIAPGRTQVVARAWDSAGATQPEAPKHLWNPHGYINSAWARIEVLTPR